jgi:hypothetical protein
MNLKHKGEKQELDHNTRPETYIKAGQISVEMPGQLLMEIDSVGYMHALIAAWNLD